MYSYVPTNDDSAPLDFIDDDKSTESEALDNNIQQDTKDIKSDTTNTPPESSDTGGCLIATAAYGSELAPQVQFLREIRDNMLMSTTSGSSFMNGFNQVYYSFSPAIADLERENPIFRDIVRTTITPALYAMNIMALADTGSEISVLVLGILSIGVIGGMYVIVPYLVIMAISRKVRPVNDCVQT